MIDERYREALQRILNEDPRYEIQAYDFVNDAVSYTIDKLKRTDLAPAQRHVTPSELVTGVLEHAAQEFGPLAGKVMEYWNLQSGLDVGNVVFNMIRHDILSASPDDKLEDFDGIRSIPALLEETHREAMKTTPPPDITALK